MWVIEGSIRLHMERFTSQGGSGPDHFAGSAILLQVATHYSSHSCVRSALLITPFCSCEELDFAIILGKVLPPVILSSQSAGVTWRDYR